MAFSFSSPQFSLATPQQQQSSPLLFTPQQGLQQQQQQKQQQGLQQQQLQQQQILLLTKEKAPLSYHTKWADLLPDSQNLLLQVEQRILEYRHECRQLDQCERLFNSAALNEGFEIDAARISQELGQIATAMDRETISIQELMKTTKEMMRNAEMAVRSFMMLRSRFAHAISTSVSNNMAIASHPSGMGATQPVPSSMPVLEFYSGVPVKPSPFLQQTVHRFEHRLQEYKQWIEELEMLLLTESDDSGKDGCGLSLLQSLPRVMSNIHDFCICVAAKVEHLHQQIGSIRSAYLADQRRKGDDNNPFLEADRREVAKKEAAARRIHPTLQAVSMGSPSMPQMMGLLTSGTTASNTPSTLLASSPAPLFSSSSMLSSTSSAFGTPSTTMPSLPPFGTSSASTSTLFGSAGQSTSSFLGTASSISILGSSPSPFASAFSAASGATTSGGLFGSTPMTSGALLGSSPSPSGGLFSGGQSSGNLFGNPVQPFGGTTGAPAFGIGSTQATNTTKAKVRTTRRK